MLEMQRYILLRQNFLDIAEPFVNDNFLNELKRYYEHDIESNRKLSRIKDFRTFIRLLEKRNIISYDNIEQLLYISKTYVNNLGMENRLLEYIDWLQNIPSFCNMYQSDYKTCDIYGSIHNSSHALTQSSTILSSRITQESHYYEQEDDKKKLLQQEVLLQISKRVGRSWRDVARHLGIRECEIDAVQNKYPNNQKEQSYEILKIYISQSDKKQWAINILQALEKGRRRDLKEHVEKLILKDRENI